MTPDPRPAKRRKASTQQWKRIREQFKNQPCQVCGKPWESLHHIVSKSLRGDDVYANLAPLCGDGTSGCHGAIENRDNGARGRLAASLTHVQRVYVVNKMGAGWLERNYPEWRDAA